MFWWQACACKQINCFVYYWRSQIITMCVFLWLTYLFEFFFNDDFYFYKSLALKMCRLSNIFGMRGKNNNGKCMEDIVIWKIKEI